MSEPSKVERDVEIVLAHKGFTPAEAESVERLTERISELEAALEWRTSEFHSAVAHRRRIERRIVELERDERMTRESGLALIADAERWSNAYAKARDDLSAREQEVERLRVELNKAANYAESSAHIARAALRGGERGSNLGEIARERDNAAQISGMVERQLEARIARYEEALREIAQIGSKLPERERSVESEIARAALRGGESGSEIPWGPDHPSYDEMGQ